MESVNIFGRWIVPEEALLTDDQVLGPEYFFEDVICKSSTNVLKWLARHKLIRNAYRCNTCEESMLMKKESRLQDGFRWRCTRCGGTKSVRDGSFFSKSKLSLQKLVKLLYLWCMDTPQTFILHELQMSDTSQKTISDWCNLCRELCDREIEINFEQIGGIHESGMSRIVEIGESFFFRRKYHFGDFTPGQWVFGGIERGSKRCFLIPVPNKSTETLVQLLERFILPGTIVISDGWAAYNSISHLNGGCYEHLRVMRQTNFVDMQSSYIHTKNVEKMWMRAKCKLERQYGTSTSLFKSYLNEFQWRAQCGNDRIFNKFMNVIRRQYVV